MESTLSGPEIASGGVWLAIADIHLRSEDNAGEEMLLKLLDKYEDRLGGLILLGDIFDIWFGYKHAIFFQAIRFLAKLKDLSLRGIPIIYLEGNHDFYLKGFFKDYIRADVRRSAELELFSKKIYASHGDEFNYDKIDYRITRSLMSSRLLQFLVSLLPVDLCFRLFSVFSGLSRRFSKKKEYDTERYISNIARRFRSKDAEIILTAHNHIEMDIEIRVDDRAVRIMNPGSFQDSLKYIVISKEVTELRTLDALS